MVLVRPGPRGVVEVRLTLDGRVGREPLVVDGQVDRVDAVRVEAEPLDDALADPLADDDDVRRPARRPVVRQAPEQPLAAWEERGQIEVLDVEQRENSRALGRRHGDGERVVDDVGSREPLAEATGA